MMQNRYRNITLRPDDAASRSYFGSHVKSKNVCFTCRKVYKSGLGGGTNRCSMCGGPLMNCGKSWRFPKRRDVKGWEREEKRWKAWRNPTPVSSPHAPYRPFWRSQDTIDPKAKQNQPSNWYF